MIFLPDRTLTDGGTRKAKGTQAMVVLGQACRGGPSQMRGCINPRCYVSWRTSRRLPDGTETSSGARNVEKILSRTLLPELSAEVLSRLADGATINGVTVGVDTGGSFQYHIG
jgi:hypothetical protein